MNHIQLHEGFPLLPHPRARAVIDPEALTHNFHALMDPVRAVSPSTHAIAVVKADAYGHGIRPVTQALLAAGCRSFAVACLEEAVALRRLLRELMTGSASDLLTDILVLGHTDPRNAPILAAYHITATLLSAEYASRLLACAREARVTVKGHIALDTGMNRIGYPAHTEEEISETVAAVRALWREGTPTPEEGGLSVDGLFTHFARSDEDFDTEMRDPHSLTLLQYDRYRRVCEALAEAGISPRVRHVCNSAATVRFPYALPEGCLDAVRLGINLYGYGVPSPHTGKEIPSMRPAMRLECSVTHIHTLLPGETVGYGGDFSADTPRTLATLPVGYADGWLRAFSGAEVTFHTPRGDFTAPIVGRICMDQCMVDVTGLPVAVGDTVTLFGETPHQLESLAARAHTITYELLCLVTARIPRIYPGAGPDLI